MDPIIITSGEDTPQVDWVSDPQFVFASEIDALTTLTALGDQIEGARKQLEHAMRWMGAAVRAARAVTEDTDQQTTVQAIMGASGLSRRTVYNMINGR